VIHSYGVVGTLRLSALFVLVGSALLALANSVPQMSAARTLVGLGCGISTTTVPLVLATVAPAHIRRSVGLLNQLFIVAGVLLGQALSFPLG
jgi:MFS family permease